MIRATSMLAALACISSAGPACAGPEYYQSNEIGMSAYEKNCAYCHRGGNPIAMQAPTLAGLRKLPYERVREAVVNGRMKVNAKFVTAEELEPLMRYVAAEPPAKE